MFELFSNYISLIILLYISDYGSDGLISAFDMPEETITRNLELLMEHGLIRINPKGSDYILTKHGQKHIEFINKVIKK